MYMQIAILENDSSGMLKTIWLKLDQLLSVDKLRIRKMKFTEVDTDIFQRFSEFTWISTFADKVKLYNKFLSTIVNYGNVLGKVWYKNDDWIYLFAISVPIQT